MEVREHTNLFVTAQAGDQVAEADVPWVPPVPVSVSATRRVPLNEGAGAQFTRMVNNSRKTRTKDSFQSVMDLMAKSAGRIDLSSSNRTES